MGAVPIPDTWRKGSPPRTRHASQRSGRRYLTQRASLAARFSRRAFTTSTSTRATRGGVGTAFRGAKLSTKSQSKRPGARPGGGRGSGGQRSAAGSAPGGGSRGSLDRQPAGRPPRLAARLAPARQVSGGAAGSRAGGRAGGRAGRADSGDAHRLGVGAGGDCARPPPATPGPHGGGSLAARRPVFSYKPRWQERRWRRRRLRNLPASRGNVSAAPRPTHASESRLAGARKARAREGGAPPTTHTRGGAGRQRRTGTGACPQAGAGRVRRSPAPARGAGRGSRRGGVGAKAAGEAGWVCGSELPTGGASALGCLRTTGRCNRDRHVLQMDATFFYRN